MYTVLLLAFVCLTTVLVQLTSYRQAKPSAGSVYTLKTEGYVESPRQQTTVSFGSPIMHEIEQADALSPPVEQPTARAVRIARKNCALKYTTSGIVLQTLAPYTPKTSFKKATIGPGTFIAIVTPPSVT